uniref:Uncharacterized protein n=1 Tax=Timema bartmani TaxID=61472 RepID=A0A7R9ESF0_9NEOP|nr:unnamed protein product [Timema bartmani]
MLEALSINGGTIETSCPIKPKVTITASMSQYTDKLRFLLIDRLLEQSLTIEVGKCLRRQEERLEEVRLLHVELSGVANLANKCYGNSATIFVSILCVNTLIELFIFCFVSKSMAQLIFLLMDVFGIFFTTTVGGYLIDTNNTLLDRLIAIPLTRFSMACQIQIFMAIMTHFIVVIQFSTQLKDFSTTVMKTMNST